MLSPATSQWGSADCARVSFHVAVSLDALRTLYGQGDPMSPPTFDRDSHWYTGLLQVVPDAGDNLYWPIRLDHVDVDADALLRMLVSYAIPELDKATSIAGLLERLPTPINFIGPRAIQENYSALLAITGQYEALAKYVEQVRAEFATHDWDEDYLARVNAEWDAHLARLPRADP